ncbi:MAG: hypothetical protein OEW67_06500 [Cyclobacteriaceae bacterium]|nr:hypothetical protein [Cyclobacteriaceae bacterium]
MKRTMILNLAILLALVFSNYVVYAQDSDESNDLRVFGLGMHIEQFKWLDIASFSGVAPVNKIMLTITPSNSFRIEPEFGFNYYNNKTGANSNTGYLKNRVTTFGIGVFGMKQWTKTNIYYGLRMDNGIVKNEYEDFNFNGNLIIETEKINRFSIGPSIGVEYLFGKHFSFGGEIGIKSITNKSTNSQFSVNGETKESYFATDTGLLIRFYF